MFALQDRFWLKPAERLKKSIRAKINPGDAEKGTWLTCLENMSLMFLGTADLNSMETLEKNPDKLVTLPVVD